MKLTILGTRGEIEVTAPYHSKHSGILLDDHILLDCGEEQFLDYKPKAILITHLHPDHAFFVRDAYQTITNPIYAPEHYKKQPITITKKSFSIGKYHITPIPTVHSVKVRSNAYLIEHDDQRMLYTGDMIWIEKQYHHLLQDLDLVITEASSMRQDGLIRRHAESGQVFGHTGVPNLIHFFSKYTCNILFVHFGSWFYEDIKKARKQFQTLAKHHQINTIVGYEGLTLYLEKR